MNKNTFVLALIALAAIMLTGCKDPVGVPGRAHAALARTYYANLNGQEQKWSGHLDGYAGRMTPDSIVDSIVPTITRAYTVYQSRPYPRKTGYTVFHVDEFDGSTGVVVCTLYYYQSAHYGTPNLELRYINPGTGTPSAHDLFWGAWDSNILLASDSTHDQNGWYAVPLTAEAVDTICAMGGSPRYGADLYTGWVYPGYTSGIHTDVDGAGSDYPPYIKIVVTN